MKCTSFTGFGLLMAGLAAAAFAGGWWVIPMEELPTKLLSIKPLSISSDSLGRRLRKSDPPVFSRIQQDCVLLDLRTGLEDELDFLTTALESSLAIGDMNDAS